MKKYKIIADNIKNLRKINVLTQKDLAKLVHKSEITIRKYESGDTFIPVPSLIDICRLFGIAPIEILTSDDKSEEAKILLDEYTPYFNLDALYTHPSDYEFFTRVNHGYGDNSIIINSLISHTAINEKIDISSSDLTPIEKKRIFMVVTAVTKTLLLECKQNRLKYGDKNGKL